MSERFTAINLPGSQAPTYQDRGLVSTPELIAKYREMAEWDLKNAQDILAAKDEEFKIETYLGNYAMNKRRNIQPGKPL